MNRLLAEYQCDASLDGVGKLRGLLGQVLNSSVQERELHAKALLCLSEAVTNIVRHGQPRASLVRFSFRQVNQSWRLTISDDGGSFDPAVGQGPGLSEIPQDMESGRGLALMEASCDQISYTEGRGGELNRLIFAWPVKPQTDRPTVLLVEDESSVRALYRTYLAERYRVVESANGAEAMQVLAGTRVDLVLSDINMPSMNGLDLRAEITRNPEHELIPFVFLTSSEEAELRGMASSLGIDDYIVKPVSKSALIDHLERVLQRNHQIVTQLSSRINRKISQSFAASLPVDVPNWSIAIARRDTGIGGGDFLLSQSLDESALFVLIDTMGHDETSKFFSYAYGGYISGILRSATRSEIECDEVLARISEMAYDDELLSRVTLSGIVFHLQPDGGIKLASAAHPQPLLVSADSTESIPVEGVLPGLLPDARYEPLSLKLEADERIAIFTDGLLESADDNRTRDNLRAQIWSVIQETARLPLERASRLVMQKFDELAGLPPRDDTTLILLQPKITTTEVSYA